MGVKRKKDTEKLNCARNPKPYTTRYICDVCSTGLGVSVVHILQMNVEGQTEG